MGILLDKLTAYGESDYYPYHMPGHKRRLSHTIPVEWIETDITEIEGFDNLHQSEGVLKTLQDKAARAYGAEESFYLVNGSTAGILAAISAAVPFGKELLIARNSHKAVYHAAYLRKLTLHYIYPGVLETFSICEAITAQQVEEALEQYPQVAAVLIVSPTYEGRIADVEAIAGVVHERGIPLIVDEAHGAHLGFSPLFATNSAALGADLVINSVHKTLPALTQTALLHVNGELVDREKLKRFLRIYQSSSPSYLLMSSIEEAIDIASDQSLFERFAANWNTLLKELSACKNLRILPMDYRMCRDRKHDIGKLIISVEETQLSGQELYDILLEDYHLQPEMACESYVLCMFTIGDDAQGYKRLTKALLTIDHRLQKRKCLRRGQMPILKESQPLFEAWEQEKEYIPIERAEGRMVGEFINLYPPGIPVAVPGEEITKDIIEWLQDCRRGGLAVQGIRGDGYIAVIK